MSTLSLHGARILFKCREFGSIVSPVKLFQPASSEEAQRCDLWEYFPLELRRHAVDSIHILEVIVFRIPFDFALPGRNRIIFHFSQTEHRVGEVVGFGMGHSISSAAQLACRHPRQLFEINRVYTSDFFFCSLISFPASLNNCPTLFQR